MPGAAKILDLGQDWLGPMARRLPWRPPGFRARPAGSPRFRANRELLDREIREKATVLASHPTILVIDPATACNLKCPFCPTGGGYSGIAKERLEPETFERIVDHLDLDLLEEVLLYNWGEPLLNPHLPSYIRTFADAGKTTEISVNFSTRDYDARFFETLVESGLTQVVVSVDGASQESYSKYRVGGKLERVVANMKGLTAAKERLKSRSPRMTFRMLLNRFNEHEAEAARELAEDCGADFNLDHNFWCPDEHRDEWMARSLLPDAPEGSTPESPPEPTPATPPEAEALATAPRQAPATAEGEPNPSAEAFPSDGEEVEMSAPKPVFTHEDKEGIDTFCRQMWDSAIVNANGDVYP
ncbi:MAG: radical SAM protein, partial [Holophagales bacterium]|nr:radical SAM protein [Holophagales bacterium]